uniref:Oligodendrocyte myelin glycoprotein n=1 Tax=Stegastes partitus TaxID=144197 RepID=A0A3B4ZDD3_9TELE
WHPCIFAAALLIGLSLVLCICPSVCSCSGGHRVVDCSSRGLTKFWTVPTNMPHNLESIDLSHNYLAQIIPGSLDRLQRLAQFYLHANRFSWLSEGIFDKLIGLEMITLGDNPWACEEEENITRLLRWAEQTHATVLGCPCYTRPICGKTHLATTGKHSALHDGQSPARTAEVTSTIYTLSDTDLLLQTSPQNLDGVSQDFGEQILYHFSGMFWLMPNCFQDPNFWLMILGFLEECGGKSPSLFYTL